MMGGQHHAPAALPTGKTRYPLYRRLGWPQGRSGRGKEYKTIFLKQRPAFDYTRQQLNFHQPSAHLKKYQLGPYYMAIRLFNTLPATLKTSLTVPSDLGHFKKNPIGV